MLPTDAYLFNLVAAGNEQAFSQIYKTYTYSIHAHVKRIIRDPFFVSDIVHEVFLTVWEKREQLAGIENPSAWLYRVAGNLSVSHLRRQQVGGRALREIGEGTTQITPEKRMEITQLRIMMQTAISLLPNQRRQVFILYSEEKLTRRQIATRLNISENTVRNQLALSKTFLQEYIVKHAGITLPLVLLFPLHLTV